MVYSVVSPYQSSSEERMGITVWCGKQPVLANHPIDRLIQSLAQNRSSQNELPVVVDGFWAPGVAHAK